MEQMEPMEPIRYMNNSCTNVLQATMAMAIMVLMALMALMVLMSLQECVMAMHALLQQMSVFHVKILVCSVLIKYLMLLIFMDGAISQICKQMF